MVRLTSTLRENHTEHVSERGKGYEDRESTFSAYTEHVAEEQGSDDSSRADDILFWYCGKVCDLQTLSAKIRDEKNSVFTLTSM